MTIEKMKDGCALDIIGSISPTLSARVEKIISYESGTMSDDDMVSFFQELINDGSAWTLQGHYGRTAKALIENGHCKPKEEER